MIVFNYNRLLKQFYPLMLKYAKKIDANDYDDNLQEIRIFVFQYIDRFDINTASLYFYMDLLIKTAYRRIIYDQSKQSEFENSFCELGIDFVNWEQDSDCENLITEIISQTNDDTLIQILWALLYRGKTYREISRATKIPYQRTLYKVREIRKIVEKIIDGQLQEEEVH